MPNINSPITPIPNTIMGVVQSITPSPDGIHDSVLVIREFSIDLRTGTYLIPQRPSDLSTIGTQNTLFIPASASTFLKGIPGAPPGSISDIHPTDYVRIYKVGANPVTKVLRVTRFRQPLKQDNPPAIDAPIESIDWFGNAILGINADGSADAFGSYNPTIVLKASGSADLFGSYVPTIVVRGSGSVDLFGSYIPTDVENASGFADAFGSADLEELDNLFYLWAADPAFSVAFKLRRSDADAVQDSAFGTISLPLFDTPFLNPSSCCGQSGKLLAAGIHEDYPPTSAPFIIRLSPDGSLDQSFGTNGMVLIPVVISSHTADGPRGLSIRPDGSNKISAVVKMSDGVAAVSFHLLTWSSEGTELTRSDIGLTDIDLRGILHANCILANGNFVCLLSSFTHKVIILASNGSVVLKIPLGSISYVLASLVGQSDGKFLLGLILDDNTSLELIRYLANGTVDFNIVIPTSITSIDAIHVSLSSDNKILVSLLDETASQLTIYRFNADGTIDSTFGTNGIASGSIDLTNLAGIILGNVVN